MRQLHPFYILRLALATSSYQADRPKTETLHPPSHSLLPVTDSVTWLLLLLLPPLLCINSSHSFIFAPWIYLSKPKWSLSQWQIESTRDSESEETVESSSQLASWLAGWLAHLCCPLSFRLYISAMAESEAERPWPAGMPEKRVQRPSSPFLCAYSKGRAVPADARTGKR